MKYSIHITFYIDGSIASFVTPVDQKKYYGILICNQEKHLHYEEKIRKNIRHDAYELIT